MANYSPTNDYRINVINYYQTIMYKNLGITGKKNLLVTGIYNCMGPLTSEYGLTLGTEH
jgi:hypothetical protein